MPATQLKPDYIFEISWEVCNKVGGINTVIATKAKTLLKEYRERLIMVGPDIWKGHGENPEFVENKFLFRSFRDYAASEGLKLKIGRWNIPGAPITILVDFTPLFVRKNEILTDLWIKYQLDSLTGQWDYIEPALFGYAAGQAIECFYRYHLNASDKIIAQFHEWMTGCGVLYLEDKAPQIATVFTTHATVLGRCIAGNGLPFYSHFENYNADQVAKEFNVVAKHSLEKITAHNADAFTTVSEITTRECEKFLEKAPDFITHNGFDPSIVPDSSLFNQKRAIARAKILEVAQALLGQKLPDDSLLIIKSGRYEFKNKGIDIFIESLAKLNADPSLTKNVIGLIFVPAHQTGPRNDLIERMHNHDLSQPRIGDVLTHYLQGADTDPIMAAIKKAGLNNGPEQKVKIVFVPTYLDGRDGIFDLTYYDVLIGFDLAIFPSYYEPWGYTPLEGIAFHIPAITTSVSGFGMVVKSTVADPDDAIAVVNRSDNNEDEVADNIASIIVGFTKKSESEINTIRNDAAKISRLFSWDNQIANYKTAYSLALEKSLKREDLFKYKPQAEPVVVTEAAIENKPLWRNIAIKFELPPSLAALEKISRNLWCSWDCDALALFEYMDKDAWHRCNCNPIHMIQTMSFDKIKQLEQDKVFTKMLGAVEQKIDKYLSLKKDDHKPLVAYFCMEYGLVSYLKLYSGGLGVLAGDYLKEASDQGLNMVGIGLLYKNGYFKQGFSVHGEQYAQPDVQDLSQLPLQMVNDKNGNPVTVTLALPGRNVLAQVWRLDVGRVPLYLLDTNVNENNPEDRHITTTLYEGNNEVRLKQELLLGFGGIRLLRALGIKPDVYHCNDGHAAFIGIERLDDLITDEKLSYEEALEVVKSSTLFTTHTSVPAANDTFSEELLRTYISHKAQRFNIEWSTLFNLGRENPEDKDEKFAMTYLAAKQSQEINAVSKIHEAVSRHLLNPLWKDFRYNELHITSVTNGVHYPTWTGEKWQRLYANAFGQAYNKLSDKRSWQKIYDIPDDAIWSIRTAQKKELIDLLKRRLTKRIAAHSNPRKALQIINNLNENALLVGFARRFALYKRSDLLFYDLERLLKIVSDKGKPIQFFYAGKAHPNDRASIDMIKHILEVIDNPAFENKIIFLEDYDMELARKLVQCVDVWLNTPNRAMEASGTSGMKAAMNGVLNFSVLDGWWAEAYQEDAGWALSAEPTYEQQEFQNQLDAETIYATLENEIIPLYYERNAAGIPEQWIKKIKKSLSYMPADYSTERMITEYKEFYYDRLYSRHTNLISNNFSVVKDLVAWKKSIIKHWKEVDIISVEVPNAQTEKAALGERFYAKIVIDFGSLTPEDIGIDVIFIRKDNGEGKADDSVFLTEELSLIGSQNGEATFECDLSLIHTGTYEYTFRIFPKNALLQYRQDFSLVKWI